jgi:hypothetical protein
MRKKEVIQENLAEELVSSEQPTTESETTPVVRSRAQAMPRRERARKPQKKAGMHFNTESTPGYHTHYVSFGRNDSFGKIQYLLDKGYRFVDLSGEEATDLDRIQDARQLQRFSGIPDQYTGSYHYKMQIPIEWYKEDREEAEAARRAKDKFIHPEKYRAHTSSNRTYEDETHMQFFEVHKN